MLLTPWGVDFVNTLLYHLEALQLPFFSFFLSSLTLSEGYNTPECAIFSKRRQYAIMMFHECPEAVRKLPSF